MKTHKSAVSSKKHILFVGYLVPRKNVIKILNVVQRLQNIRDDFILDIVGDGSDKGNLELFVRENGIEKFVNFHGYKQKNELPQFYAQTDCFLFQTDFDIWGLVLVEAMASGLPCIGSVNAGATSDLIENGKTGFAMNFDDIDKVVESVDWILSNPIKAQEIGRNASRYISENVNLKTSAAGFLKAVQFA